MVDLKTRAAAMTLAAGVTLAGGATLAPGLASASTAINSVGQCVPSTSPLVVCDPATVIGPSPGTVRIGDSFTLKLYNFRANSAVTVFFRYFPNKERNRTGKIGADGTLTLTITIPFETYAQYTPVDIAGISSTRGVVTFSRRLTIKKAVKPLIVQKLRDKNLYRNIDPSVQKASDKKHLAAGSKGAALQGTVLSSAHVAAAASQPSGVLAFTGAEIAGISVLGLGLLGSGAFLVVAGRRKATS